MHVDDFKTLYRDHFPKGDPDKFAEHVFSVFDKDSDGEINFKDFITTLSVQLKGTTVDKLGWAFDLYDTHHHGYISEGELKDMIQVGKVPEILLKGIDTFIHTQHIDLPDTRLMRIIALLVL